MCGISCIITQSEIGITDRFKYLSQISDMSDVVSHRGPDAKGTFIDIRGVALGHRRLKIIDLSDDANQPMSMIPTINRGKVHIVYNGEIYNYIELREKLKKRGYFFKTQSDTEVLLNMYIEYGRGCLEQLNGMFSFVIYDEYKGVIFAARDRYGIKPFYWWTSPLGFVAFASEIKQFTVLEGWESHANMSMVNDYLRMGMVDHTSGTMFRGVHQLRGGEAVYANLDDIMSGCGVSGFVYQWYDIANDEYPLDYSNAVADVKRILSDSVRLRCVRSDVPVGSCLSGGIDSSSVVCLANEYYSDKKKQHTFTMASDDKQFDETDYARSVIESCNTNYHFIYPSVDKLFEYLDDMVWHQDEPFTSTSMYGQYEVFKRAKEEGIKVMLDGQGADELFCGYHYVFPIRLFSLFKSKRYWQFLSELLEFKTIPRFKYFDLLRVVYNKIKSKSSGTPQYRSIPMDYSTLQAYSNTLMKYTSLPALLHWEDRNSAAHSIEARLPFLDYRLVDLVYGMADDYKLYDAITKRVLRDAMFKIIPNKVRGRKDKIGFQTSEEMWFHLYPDEFKTRFYEAMKLSNGLITHEDATNLENTIMHKRDYDYMIWRCICLGAWIKRFGVMVDSGSAEI